MAQPSVAEQVQEALEICRKVSLPVIPSEVVWLQNALQDEKTSFYDVIKRLESQTGIVEQIIQTSNQVLLKKDNPITTISQAVNFLGASSLYHLVVTSYFQQLLEKNSDAHVVLEHSIWVARAMTLIERQTRHEEPDFAYTIGLFHNLGALVLSFYDPDRYIEFFQQSRAFPMTALDKEVVRYGTQHCMLGMIMGKKWQLPKIMLELIYRHHTLDIESLNDPKQQFWIARLRLANGLVDQVYYEVYKTSEIRESENQALSFLKLTPEYYEQLKYQFAQYFLNKS